MLRGMLPKAYQGYRNLPRRTHSALMVGTGNADTQTLLKVFLNNRVNCSSCGQGKQYLCGKGPKEERLQSCVLKGQEKNFRSNEKESMKKGAVKFKNHTIMWSMASPTFW